MIVAPHPAEIRDLVFRTFLEFDADEDALADLDERMLIDDGKLRPVVDRVFPLDEARDAMAYVEQGNAKGKVVVSVAG